MPQKVPVHKHLLGVEHWGRQPTVLMENIMATLSPGDLAGYLFKAFFLHRLPADLKDLVAVQFQQLEVRGLLYQPSSRLSLYF